MITVVEEVERALQLVTKHQNLKNHQNHKLTLPVNENFTKHQNLKSDNNQKQKLTSPVNETTRCITLSSDEDEGVQDVNMGAEGGEVKRKVKVLPDKNSAHQNGFTGKCGRSMDTTRPPLHCVIPAQEPMFGCSDFDSSIVLCEEVRVKVEQPDEILEETQDPLVVCESTNIGESTDDNEGVKQAVKIKECSVMLHRKILDKKIPANSAEDWAAVVCDKCGKRFLNRWTFMKHTKRMHKGKCKVAGCERPFFYHLGVHMRMMHGHPKLKCEKCDAEFISNQGLKRHMARKHNIGVYTGGKQPKLKCKVVGCEKPFFRSLGVHMRMMHGQPKLKCGSCDSEFYSKQGLKRHIVSKHEISN